MFRASYYIELKNSMLKRRMLEYRIKTNSSEYEELSKWMFDNDAKATLHTEFGFVGGDLVNYVRSIIFYDEEDRNLFLLTYNTMKFHIREDV